MHIIYTDGVQVGERHRKLDHEKVKALVESIDRIGLQTPISVWVDGDDVPHLVAGRHRLEAFKVLGKDTIPAVCVEMDELDRELWEIEENLVRADLTDLERAWHNKRHIELVQAREQRRKGLMPESGKNSKGGRPSKGAAKAVAETAAATGQSKSQVRQDKHRADKIAEDVQKEIEDTDIADSGVELDALASMSHDDQREAVKMVSLGHAKNVREAKAALAPDVTAEHLKAEKEFDRLWNAWCDAGGAARRKFLARIKE